jgi:hypothetical protein
MMTTATATAAGREQGGAAQPGEALTRRAVTLITAAIVVMAFAFSLGNVTRLCLLCRRRHNTHYAELRIMRRAVFPPLVAGAGVLSGAA